ncbi:MAG: hypothetical protein OXF99_07840 [bacterium]|nr:hypothetical protein [bacterium]
MDDMSIIAIIFSAQAFVFILVMAPMTWKQAKERKERELRDFIAQSFEEWPVKTALEDWLKTALANWPVNNVLREQVSEIVETEVRRQLLDAKIKAA